MVGGREMLLWTRHCLPTSATQHDARAQPRRRRSGEEGSCDLSSPCPPAAGYIGREETPSTTRSPSRTRGQTSGAHLVRTLRPSCRVEMCAPAKGRWSKGSARRPLPFSSYLGHPLSRNTRGLKVGMPCYLRAPAENREPAPPAKRRLDRAALGAFHRPEVLGADAPSLASEPAASDRVAPEGCHALFPLAPFLPDPISPAVDAPMGEGQARSTT